MPRAAEELRELVEGYLAELAFTPELGGLEAAVRYPLEAGGKRIRPVLCLAVGDALLAEAFRLALSYPTTAVARELAQATLGMIGGQYRDVTGDTSDLAALHRLKTGSLLAASVGLPLHVAEVPEREQAPWRAFGDELGLLFQIVDDVLDGDGYAERHGEDGARALADDAAARAQERLAEIPADTSVLAEIVESLAARTS